MKYWRKWEEIFRFGAFFQLNFSIHFTQCRVACLIKLQQIKPFFLHDWNYLMKQGHALKTSLSLVLSGMGKQQNW